MRLFDMFCKRKVVDFARSHSNEIQRGLNHDAKLREEFVHLLLLGTGESGKTTIIKQMKILHCNGYTQEEKIKKIPDILQNVQESIYDIVDSMTKLNPPIHLTQKNSLESAKYILNLGSTILTEYTQEYYGHVKTLWLDSNVKKCFQRSNEYQLIESARYFLDRIDVIRTSDYVPTTEDLLHCRKRTVGISTTEFGVQVPKKYGGGEAKFRMYDVGGQRGERKKWIAVFAGIQSILFLIAASDFDQTLREDETKNRLRESFELFSDMFWSRFLRDAGTIVFLNKQDVLQEKIESGRKLEKYFPEYNSYKTTSKEGTPKTEFEKVKLFLRREILDISKDKPSPELIGIIPGYNVIQEMDDREVHIHFTIATDTNNIKKVFTSVHEIILSSILKTSVLH